MIAAVHLGYPYGVHVYVWIPAARGGARAHFEPPAMLSVQVEGTKTWHVSTTPALTAPARMAVLLVDGAESYPGGREPPEERDASANPTWSRSGKNAGKEQALRSNNAQDTTLR